MSASAPSVGQMRLCNSARTTGESVQTKTSRDPGTSHTVLVTTLVVAAGGGGDALGVLLLRELLGDLGDLGEQPLIATFAWERLRVDPMPGPRGRTGFVGLADVAGQPAEIVARTDTIPSGRSSLPRLAAETDARLFLLDSEHGAVGLGTQLTHLAHTLAVEQLIVVNFGGAAIAAGTEPGIRSPLADARGGRRPNRPAHNGRGRRSRT
jgi:hypothetical protein